MGGDATAYLRDKLNPTGYSQVLEEVTTKPNAAVEKRSFLVGNDVIAQADGSTVRHLLYDGGGSTRALLDAGGQVASGQLFAYDAFGTRIQDPSNTIAVATPLLYRGEYLDAVPP